MFASVTFFTSLDAVRGFAGDDYQQAVVEDAARHALSRWDERVSHHEVAAEFEEPAPDHSGIAAPNAATLRHGCLATAIRSDALPAA